jgi:hypothetical protein
LFASGTLLGLITHHYGVLLEEVQSLHSESLVEEAG